ncbi:MAG: glycosyltransferase family 4 protein [Candidatus Glassbacteria bacterium]|nr:glycosyltransferase family 4 protein [Candidatus Glassbacteria bacterium]
MKILMLTQYFYPEVGATQTRIHEFARNLIDHGHDVTVITEVPNHPIGIVHEKYQGQLFIEEEYDGIRVIRVWVWAREKKNFANRILFYLSYMVMSFFAGLYFRGKYDIIFATSPPLFVGVSGYLLSIFKRGKFVLDVRDLWPAAATALGELSNRRIVEMAEKIEQILYNNADAIVAVTRGFCDFISNKVGGREKIHYIPNGTVVDLFVPQQTDKDLKKSLGLDGKFVVTFAGTLGIAQGLWSTLHAAKLLRHYDDIALLMIGEGPVKRSLIDLTRELRLNNVFFHSQVPINRITPYLNLSDVLLVSLKDDTVFDTFIPSKMFDFMACGIPIILSVDGEARRIFEEAEAGVYVSPENFYEMSDAIVQLYEDRELCRRLGENGRRFVIENFSRREQALRLEHVFKGLLASPPPGGHVVEIPQGA